MRISNPPDASSLMATARSFGNYDLAAALADLIDNSIRAESKKVSILFEPVEKDVLVRIRDDGMGMDKNELVAAMRPASANPEDPRELNDLGRFGWGFTDAGPFDIFNTYTNFRSIVLEKARFMLSKYRA